MYYPNNVSLNVLLEMTSEGRAFNYIFRLFPEHDSSLPVDGWGENLAIYEAMLRYRKVMR